MTLKKLSPAQQNIRELHWNVDLSQRAIVFFLLQRVIKAKILKLCGAGP